MSWNIVEPATATKLKDGPSIFLGNWEIMEEWCASEHYGLDNALSGVHKSGLCSVLMVAATSAVSALTDVACGVAYDTTLNVFKYNDGSSWQNIGGPITSGTKMIFYQDTAPIGWTINNSLDDKLLFITKGSAAGGKAGGSVHSAGTWTIGGFGGTTGSYTLRTADIPSHSHAVGEPGLPPVQEFCNTIPTLGAVTPVSVSTGSAGGGSGHTHNISSNMTQNAAWRPAAYNCIICTKD